MFYGYKKYACNNLKPTWLSENYLFDNILITKKKKKKHNFIF